MIAWHRIIVGAPAKSSGRTKPWRCPARSETPQIPRRHRSAWKSEDYFRAGAIRFSDADNRNPNSPAFWPAPRKKSRAIAVPKGFVSPACGMRGNTGGVVEENVTLACSLTRPTRSVLLRGQVSPSFVHYRRSQSTLVGYFVLPPDLSCSLTTMGNVLSSQIQLKSGIVVGCR